MTAIGTFILIAQTLSAQLNAERTQAWEVAQEFSKKFVELGFKIVPQLLWAIGILLITRFAIGVVGRVTRRGTQSHRSHAAKILSSKLLKLRFW